MQSEEIGVFCVMPNDYIAHTDDDLDNMTRFAAKHGLTAPYLVDENQSLTHAYGAVCTPDFFGFDWEGGAVPRSIHDAGMKDPTGRMPELLSTMRAVAAKSQGPQD